jgi:uncharacterized membrane protein
VNLLKRIKCHMKEIARIVWSVGFPVFAVFAVGATTPYCFLQGEWYEYLISGLLALMAIICLIISIYAFIYDYRQTWLKEHPPRKTHRINFI